MPIAPLAGADPRPGLAAGGLPMGWRSRTISAVPGFSFRGNWHVVEERKMQFVDRGRATYARGAVRFLLGCLLFFAAAHQSAGQTKENPPDLKAFLGTWKASFNGDVFAVLVLKEQGGTLSGTLNNFDISVDKDGNLTDGTHKDQGDAPLLNARFKSGALVFVVMQKDQYAPSTEWKFAPRSADEGELTPVLDHQLNAPKDMVVKPIRMVREHAKP
jgi:hypothetical protein